MQSLHIHYDVQATVSLIRINSAFIRVRFFYPNTLYMPYTDVQASPAGLSLNKNVCLCKAKHIF